MIIAENARGDDMVVNPCKEKKLTNMRASGSDKNILLKPPRELTLELALEYIEDDELVEVTPSKIRLRKKILSDESRKRSERSGSRKVGVVSGAESRGSRRIDPKPVLCQHGVKIRVVPAAVAPELAPGDSFVLVAAFS